jgi:type II secretory pathway component PulK
MRIRFHLQPRVIGAKTFAPSEHNPTAMAVNVIENGKVYEEFIADADGVLAPGEAPGTLVEATEDRAEAICSAIEAKYGDRLASFELAMSPAELRQSIEADVRASVMAEVEKSAVSDKTRAKMTSLKAKVASLEGAVYPVNVNTATKAQLQAIPGVGPGTADAIISRRTSEGPFLEINDVFEMNPQKLDPQSLADHVSV